jgi:hypothetical protein
VRARACDVVRTLKLLYDKSMTPFVAYSHYDNNANFEVDSARMVMDRVVVRLRFAWLPQ